MKRRFAQLAVAFGYAFVVIAPGAANAAGAGTVWLSIQSPNAQSVKGEYQLNNYTQNNKTFTATTALDGSSAPLLLLVGQAFQQVTVRLDGQSMDTATLYKLCTMKSDNVSSSGTTQTERLSFTCGEVDVRIIPNATPSPAPVRVLDKTVPILSKPVVLPTK